MLFNLFVKEKKKWRLEKPGNLLGVIYLGTGRAAPEASQTFSSDFVTMLSQVSMGLWWSTTVRLHCLQFVLFCNALPSLLGAWSRKKDYWSWSCLYLKVLIFSFSWIFSTSIFLTQCMKTFLIVIIEPLGSLWGEWFVQSQSCCFALIPTKLCKCLLSSSRQ